jgi:hypothetical protein
MPTARSGFNKILLEELSLIASITLKIKSLWAVSLLRLPLI